MTLDPSKTRLRGRVTVMIVPDLFFAAKIQEAARAALVTTLHCPAGHALEMCQVWLPNLIIVDLHGSADVLDMVRELKADPDVRAMPIVGFYSHVDVETRRAAEAAGVDLVLPRSAFTARLGELLTRWPGPPTN
jgi:CheY-like chemotaxis protein